MKYNLIFAILMLSLTSSAQQKYILRSIPTYDSAGNLYGTQREFDYPPTKADSVQFQIESRKYINEWIDSVSRAQVIIPTTEVTLPKKRKAIKRYKQ
jgi:hypothetical protein